MTIAASLKTANTSSSTQVGMQNASVRPGASEAANKQEQSFGARWLSLLRMGNGSDRQATVRAANLSQSLSIADAEDLRTDLSGKSDAPLSREGEPILRVRHTHSERLHHKGASTERPAQIGTIEPNVPGTSPVPVMPWQPRVPEQDTSNLNGNPGEKVGTEPVSRGGARPLQIQSSSKANALVQGNGDWRAIALPTAPQKMDLAVDITRQFQGQSEPEANVLVHGKGDSRLTATPNAAQKMDLADSATSKPTSSIQPKPEISGNDTATEKNELHWAPAVEQQVQPPLGSGTSRVATTVMQPQSRNGGAPSATGSHQGADVQDAAKAARPIPIPSNETASGSASAFAERINSARPANAQAPHNLLNHAGPPPQGQSHVAFAPSSIAQETANHVQNTSLPSRAPSPTAPSASIHQTFAALDAADGSETTKWLHATRNTAEAGFEDPVLGWVGVKAQVGQSGVHATVVPVSADAAQALGAHFSGLNAYLSEHRTPVERLTMSAPDSQAGQNFMDQRGGFSFGQGGDQGSNSQSNGDRGRSIQASQHPVVTPESNSTTSPVQLADSGGSYISVLA